MRVAEVASGLAHRAKRLHCEGANIISVQKVAVLLQFSIGYVISERAGTYKVDPQVAWGARQMPKAIDIFC